MQKSKLAGLAVGLIVIIAFISSYVSLTSYSNQTATTSIPATYLGIGLANAKLTGYGSPLYFNLVCSNKTQLNTTSQIITANLSVLENNNSVLNFYSPNVKNISVAPENMSSYAIYQFILSKLNSTEQSCVTTYSNAVVLLPAVVNLTIGMQHFNVQMPAADRNLTLFSSLTRGVNQTLKVKVSVLVTENLTVYGTPTIVLLSSNAAPSNTLTSTVSPVTNTNSTANTMTTSNSMMESNTITNSTNTINSSNTMPTNGVT